MDKEKIEKDIAGWTTDVLGEMPDYFLVEVKVSPKNEVKVFIDADQGASIDKLASINRSLYKKIETEALFGANGNFSMEVSSPGLDEPLKMLRQYQKNLHRAVEVLQLDGVKSEGILQEVSETGIKLEQRKSSKKEKQISIIEIPFNQIKFTKVSVVFKTAKSWQV